MLVFFGSPDFSVQSLKKLLNTEYEPALVVTQPDRPSGRGRKMIPTPVRVTAEQNGIPVKIIKSFNESEVLEYLKSLNPEFFVVVAFGLIFPEKLLGIPSKGCINVHASLLPAYRGASPINAAVINGDPFTGVTTMQMVKEVDAGPIFLQRIVPVDPMETAGGLFVRLADEGGELLLETLNKIDCSGIECYEQPTEGVSFAPMLKKRDGLIPWSKNALEVHNHIRGMNPWPGSFSYYRGNYVKIHRAEPCDLIERGADPGRVIEAAGSDLLVACGRGALKVNRLQAEGRSVLETGDFLRGFDIEAGGLFSGD